MALDKYVGVYALGSSGSQGITDPGFTPKLIIAWATITASNDTVAAHAAFSLGFATRRAGATQQRALSFGYRDNVGTSSATRAWNTALCGGYSDGVIGAIPLVSLDSFDASGFTITVTGMNANCVMHYLALGGSDIQDCIVVEDDWPTSGATFPVVGCGFQPDSMLFLTGIPTSVSASGGGSSASDTAFGFGACGLALSQAAAAIGLTNGDTMTSAMNQAQVVSADAALTVIGLNSDTVDAKGIVASYDSDGVTVTNSNAPGSALRVFALAIKGLQIKVDTFDSAVGSGNQTVSLSGQTYTPQALILYGASAAVTSNTVVAARAELNVGMIVNASGSALASVAAGETVNTTADSYRENSLTQGAINELNNGSPASVGRRSTLNSWGAGQFVVNWGAGGTAHKIGYIAIGAAAAAPATRDLTGPGNGAGVSHTAAAARIFAATRARSSSINHTAAITSPIARAVSSTIAHTAALARIFASTRAQSSSVSHTSAVARIVSFARDQASSIAHTADVARVLVLARAQASSIVHTAAPARVLVLARELASSIAHTAAVARLVSSTREQSSSIAHTATLERLVAFTRAQASSIAHTATLARALTLARVLASSIAHTAALALIYGAVRALANSTPATLSVLNADDDAQVADDGTGYTSAEGAGAGRFVRSNSNTVDAARLNAGFRFELTIPHGSPIYEAYLIHRAESALRDDPELDIYGVLESAPAGFNATTRRPFGTSTPGAGDLTLTTASVSWSALGVAPAPPADVQSPSIVPILEELVALPGGIAGSIALLEKGKNNATNRDFSTLAQESGLTTMRLFVRYGLGNGAIVTRTLVLARAQASSIAHTGTLARLAAFAREQASSIAHTGTVEGAVTVAREVASSIAHTATVERAVVQVRAVASSIAHTAAVARALVLTRGQSSSVAHDAQVEGSITPGSIELSSTIAHTGAVTRVFGAVRAQAETLGHTGNVARVLVLARELASSIAHTATVSRVVAFTREQASSIAHTATVDAAVTLTREQASSIAHTDAVARALVLARSLASSIAHTADVARNINGGALSRDAASSIAHTASLARSLTLTRAQAAGTSHTAALARLYAATRAQAASMAHTAALARLYAATRSQAASVAHTAALATVFGVARGQASSIGHTATLARSVALARAQAWTASHTGALARAVSLTRSQAAAVTHTASLTGVVSPVRALASSIAHTATLTTAFGLARAQASSIAHTAAAGRALVLARSLASSIAHTAAITLGAFVFRRRLESTITSDVMEATITVDAPLEASLSRLVEEDETLAELAAEITQ